MSHNVPYRIVWMGCVCVPEWVSVCMRYMILMASIYTLNISTIFLLLGLCSFSVVRAYTAFSFSINKAQILTFLLLCPLCLSRRSSTPRYTIIHANTHTFSITYNKILPKTFIRFIFVRFSSWVFLHSPFSLGTLGTHSYWLRRLPTSLLSYSQFVSRHIEHIVHFVSRNRITVTVSHKIYTYSIVVVLLHTVKHGMCKILSASGMGKRMERGWGGCWFGYRICKCMVYMSVSQNQHSCHAIFYYVRYTFEFAYIYKQTSNKGYTSTSQPSKAK